MGCEVLRAVHRRTRILSVYVCVCACIHVCDCPLHARDMTCSEKEKENGNHPCCLRNRARNSFIVNSGGRCGHRFRQILIYYRGKSAPGTKRLCCYNETCYNELCNNRQNMYINDAELAGTTRFLSYSEVYVISRLVILWDDL